MKLFQLNFHLHFQNLVVLQRNTWMWAMDFVIVYIYLHLTELSSDGDVGNP